MTSEGHSTVARTLSWTWQILGVLLGTATAISIIKNGFAIDVYGLPAKVLAQYVWLRDTLLAPVVWAVRYFGIEIAWWVKDMIMAYALVGAAHVRAHQVLNPVWVDEDDHHHEVQGGTSLAQSLSALLLWPQITGQLFRKWALARADRKYFARHTYGTHPDRLLPLQQAEVHLADATEQLGHIGLQVVVISLATMAFFLWNYLSGLYGPP